MKNSLKFITILVGILYFTIESQVTAAKYNELSTPFHPISQEQYDAILGLTSGEPVISEARLIASGIAALKGLAAGLGFGFSAGWLPSIFSNFVGNSQQNTTQDVLNLQDGYPLCVIKPAVDETAHQRENESTENTNHGSSIIKCIMVIKQEDNQYLEPQPEPENPTYPPPTYPPATYPPPTYAPPTDQPTEATTYPQPLPQQPAYPYSYPWYGGGFPYSPESLPAQQQQEEQEQHVESPPDYIPNFRYYPNYFDAFYAQQSKSRYVPIAYQQNPHKISQKSKSRKHKKKRTHNRQPHPAPVNYYDYTAPPPVNRRRHKTKRDQNSTNNNNNNNNNHMQQEQQQNLANNYARITNFPIGGYQPATYPQISYHSQYPKVAYSTSYNYASPVYVGTTPKSQYNRISSEEEY